MDELPETLAAAHALIAELDARNEALSHENQQLQHQIDQFLRHRFGQRSEKIDPEQYRLAFLEMEAQTPSEEDDAGEDAGIQVQAHVRQKKGHGRVRFSEDLPRERREVEPPTTTCPCCQKPMQRIGEETSEQIDYQPATLKVIQTVRPKYACATCKEGVSCAPPPASPVPKSKATAATLAHVAVSKYVDHLPLVRQASMLARQGVSVSKQTLCDWIRQISDLLEPVEGAVWESVLSSRVLMADETTVKLQEPERCRTAYLWGYLGDQDEIVFEFSTSRESEHPLRALASFRRGTLVCDGYVGYHEFLRSQAGVQRAGCWAHARREFFEAKGSDEARAPKDGAAPRRSATRSCSRCGR